MKNIRIISFLMLILLLGFISYSCKKHNYICECRGYDHDYVIIDTNFVIDAVVKKDAKTTCADIQSSRLNGNECKLKVVN